ncbi:hypothetical protein CSKR_113585 [Clonorchis sinensis]|uniref:Uncharacterized protein n=1 Tax=Clonorchis sinensis TaxID=79923 RepID=A0A419Q6J6_CLOSI|nr:hypothetical protein CSKR_113585 [Clonorchis sinensis]
MGGFMETRELRLPDKLQEGRNRSWVVGVFRNLKYGVHPRKYPTKSRILCQPKREAAFMLYVQQWKKLDLVEHARLEFGSNPTQLEVLGDLFSICFQAEPKVNENLDISLIS